MRPLLTLIFLLSFRLILVGQDEAKTGIIYGKNHAFSLTAPEGWVLDNKSGVSQGLYAVFYRKGESWAKAETVMYANTASLMNQKHTTLEQLIAYDLYNFKSNYADIVVTEGKEISIKEGVTAIVKYLSGKSYGNYEAMGYIDAGKTGVMIIMTSRTKEGFDNALAAFGDLVKSYFFMTDDVVSDKK